MSSRPRTSDGQLDLLGRALADGDTVLAPDEGLNGGVDVEASAADGLGCHHAAQGDHRRLRGPTADVDDHVADRLVDRQAGTDGRRHGLLDEVRGRRTGAARGLLHRPTLDAGDGGGDTDEDAGPVEA